MGWSDSVHKSRVSSSFLQVLNLHAQRHADTPKRSIIWKSGPLSLLLCATALLFISRRAKPSKSLEDSSDSDAFHLSSKDLLELITILETIRGRGRVVIDLGGKLLKSMESGEATRPGSGDVPLILLDDSHEGVVIRNGSLELPSHATILVKGRGIAMENVHVYQASADSLSPEPESGSPGSVASDKQTALLHVSGGSLLMELCTLGHQALDASCTPLLIDNGANVKLLSCSICMRTETLDDQPLVNGDAREDDNHPTVTHAVVVRDAGSLLEASAETCICAAVGCALLVAAGGAAELSEGCVLSGGSHGIAVIDLESQAVVDDCVIDGCGGCNVWVRGGGSAFLTTCSISASRASGIEVQGAGSCVVAKYCKVEDSVEDCLLITLGAVVDLDGCSLSGSFNRCGASLGGEGSELTASNCSFKANAECNLQVEDGAVLTLADCTLTGAQQCHGLSISGERTKVAARACTFSANELCNVHLDGGASVEFSECSMNDSKKFTGMAVGGLGSRVSAIDCVFDGNMKSNVSVYSEATVDLIGCSMRRAQELHGLVVKDVGSMVTLMDCKLENNEEVNVYVFDGAMADMTSCSLNASRSSKGLVVKGAGSRVVANGCTMHGNDEANVYVCAGAEATLEGCSVSLARRLHGMVVSGVGSWGKARECSFTSNAHIGVLAMAGARCELSACSVSDNRESSVVAEDEGSQAMIDNTTELDKDAVCVYGGKIMRRL